MTRDATAVHYTTELSAGSHWSLRLRRGLELRLVDVAGDANVGMLLYNPENPLERYNAPDTLKAQHTFRLTRGHCLYSDMGRVLASIVRDDVGWHETVCGNGDAAMVTARYGARDYQSARNDRHQNGHDAFLVELVKHGLGRRDLAANVNWFSKVVADADGNLARIAGHSPPGAEVALRIDMDALVVLHTCPHPLAAVGQGGEGANGGANGGTDGGADGAPGANGPPEAYPRGAVRITLADAAPMADDDVCLTCCAENRRGFENNRLYHLGLPERAVTPTRSLP